jgi:hypothetical protein
MATLRACAREADVVHAPKCSSRKTFVHDDTRFVLVLRVRRSKSFVKSASSAQRFSTRKQTINLKRNLTIFVLRITIIA